LKGVFQLENLHVLGLETAKRKWKVILIGAGSLFLILFMSLFAGVGSVLQQNQGLQWNVSGGNPSEYAGKMIPSTFAAYAVDGDGDGNADIQNVADAIFTAAHMLAEEGFNKNPRQAIYAYNHSDAYVNHVLLLAQQFSNGDIGGEAGSPLGEAKYQALMNEATKYEGRPYVWGGSNPSTGFDCSGLIQWVYGGIGIQLPRTAQQQYDAVQHISQAEAKPGDLIFFSGTNDTIDTVTHVGIYVGNGKMYDADDYGVGYHDLSGYWMQHLYGFGRVK
jgi:cell wall-associated NlpC family hydrolase